MPFIHGQNLHDLVQSFCHDGQTNTDPVRGAHHPEATELRATLTGGATEDGARPSESSVTGAVRLGNLRTPGTPAYHRAVAAVGVQAARGLAYAHSLGVLHRDVKPSNLLLDGSGIVRLTDFGLAKLEGEESLTQTGDVIGTLRYMAPERFAGQCDALSDVYGLGMTLYELLTLRPAYDETDRARLLDRIRNSAPESPRALRPDVPRDLETIVLKAIDPLPRARYRSAVALADDLQRYLDNRPIAARPPWWWDRTFKWARRSPAIAALCAALVLAVGTLLTDEQEVLAPLTGWDPGQGRRPIA